ncbi:MAG TPA: glycosyltransferase family 2 protein [Actinospica sp.]|nr:glycosyltransferase family 2 protein [Actinospica sp.]
MSTIEQDLDSGASTLVIPKQSGAGRHAAKPPLPSRLPQPPSDSETHLYDTRNRKLLMRVSMASFLVLTISQTRFVITAKPLLILAPFFVFTVLYYVISLWVNVGTKDFDRAAHDHLIAEWKPLAYPSLDVFLPICREDLDVLRNTWSGVSELRHSYPGQTTVYVLDDGGDPEAERVANELGFTYLTRPLEGENARGWFKKAGNLRYGFARSHGEFILVLDADFTPRADLPMHLIPYMAANPRLGIAQSPQFFRVHQGQSRMERGAGAVQELFYRLVQVSRDQRAGAICVGSCAIYRRTALEANGGSTLIGHSEDVHTGFDLRRQGWDLSYVPVPLAAGVCPETPDAFFVQQYRWCMGSMDLLRHPKFWAHKLKLRTRCCYFSGFCYYLHTAVFTIITPLIPLTMLLFLPERVRLINYIFIAPSLIYNILIFPLWHRCKFGPSAYMAKLLYGWAHLFAILDLLRGRPMGWRPTNSRASGRKNLRLWVGVWAWSGGTCALWVAAAAWRTAFGGVQFLPMLALGALNGWIVVLALLARREQAPVEGAN